MLTESFIAATEAVNKPSAHLSSALKDVGIFQHEFQPQSILRHGYKKTSILPNCLSISESHLFAAQANKAVIHVYNRAKVNQEATVPFPDRIHSLAYANKAAILIIGTEDGKLIFWEVATGRVITSAPSHLESVSSLVVTENNEQIISGSADSSVHVWSLSQLVSFSSSQQSYSDTTPKDVPLRTFSQHRAAITALGVGHSRTNTNFAVSASADNTCYLWHVESCQTLRTVLTPATPISIVLDPADRAIYLGNDDGTIHSIDLIGGSQKHSQRSIYDINGSVPIQLKTKDSWKAPTSDVGAANCLTLSYDGTSLLSGHAGGAIIRWDVAKHRVVSEIANLHQPVNSIQMLAPDGLRREVPKYVLPTIVKPRLELNAESTDNSIGLPISYNISTQVLRSSSTVTHSGAISAVLSGSLFPNSMLDDALRAMNEGSAGLTTIASAANENADKGDKYKIQALEDEKAVLEKRISSMQKLHNDAQERHRKRSEKREKIGKQRREAYFTAKKKGKDGDAAMKPYEKKLDAIDIESDEEEMRAGDEMEVDG